MASRSNKRHQRVAGSDIGGGGSANQEAAEWVGRERVGVGGGEEAEVDITRRRLRPLVEAMGWEEFSKLIYGKLIPTTHTSHIPLDRAIMLYAIIGKRKVDTQWIIYNNIIDSVKPSKGLKFQPSHSVVHPI